MNDLKKLKDFKVLEDGLFKQNIDFSGVDMYPKYKLIEAGERVLVEVSKDKFKSFLAHHIGEEGVLCDDLETFISWGMFS